MKSKCSNCGKQLELDHSFCPHCGFDLRSTASTTNSIQASPTESPIQIEELPRSTTRNGQGYFSALILGAIFSITSIFIWSYVYQGYSFDSNAFASRFINHSFWVFLLPYIVSRFFAEEKRPSVFTRAVTIAVILGIFFLFAGYTQLGEQHASTLTPQEQSELDSLNSQVQAWTPPDDAVLVERDSTTSVKAIRIQLQKACSESVVKQMAKYDISDALKKKRSQDYCSCLIDKIVDDDIKAIGKKDPLMLFGAEHLGAIVKIKYNEESMTCLEESLKK